jgi:hypothetical protein
MTDDDGTGAPPPSDPPASIDRDDLKAAIREVLAELPSFEAKALEPDDDDLGDQPVYSIRQAEDIAERAVQKAMKVLQASAKPKPRSRSTASDDGAGSGGTTDAGGAGSGSGSHSEPPPTPPPVDYKARMRKFLGA